MRKRPAAATPRCAARKSRTQRRRGRPRRRWKRAKRKRRRRRYQRERLRLARPPQLGPFAGDRLQGIHDPLRRDRRSRASCATRRSLARLRAYLDQQMGGLAECRHPPRQPPAAATSGAAGAQLGLRPGGGAARCRAAGPRGRQSAPLAVVTRSSATPNSRTPSCRC